MLSDLSKRLPIRRDYSAERLRWTNHHQTKPRDRKHEVWAKDYLEMRFVSVHQECRLFLIACLFVFHCAYTLPGEHKRGDQWELQDVLQQFAHRAEASFIIPQEDQRGIIFLGLCFLLNKNQAAKMSQNVA